jgi:DNA helicase-4
VGDDWQSIYRFTGSDNMIIKSFKDIYHTFLSFNISSEYDQRETVQLSAKKIESEPDQERVSQLFIDDATSKGGIDFDFLQDEPNASFMIQSNFRTGDAINKAASHFIQKNPFQITKEVKSNNILSNEQKERAINFCEISSYDNHSIERILKSIPEDGKKRDVFILGRKNSDFTEIKPGPLMNERPDLSIKKSTIHKAKGLESDIVILLGLEGGIKGFPNKTGDDPLVSIFLPKEDSFADSEERRVMYVAMTRAKEMIFFVNRLHDRSEFVDEVIETCKELDIKFNEDIFNQGIKPCPECQEKGNEGFMQLLKNRENKSIFLGCNFFFSLNEELQCRYTENVVPCTKCKNRGVDSELQVVERNQTYFIVCETCNHSEEF